MGKGKFILIGGAALIISCTILALLIKDKIPENIFSFVDIGTYAIPPESVEVNSANIYGQSFISNFNDLFMMSVFIPAQNLDSDKELYFHLKNNKNDKKDLIALKWKFSEIHFAENNFHVIPPDRELTDRGFHFHFQFPAIKDSRHKEFYFYFESPNTKPGKGIKLGAWLDRKYYEALTKGTMFINHRPHKGYLAFRTYNTSGGSLKDIFNEICLRFFSDRPFMIFYSCLIFVTFFGLLAIGLIGGIKR